MAEDRIKMKNNTITEHLILAANTQFDIDDSTIEELPLNIIMEDGVVYPLSFIVDESRDYLNIVFTTDKGHEHIAVLNKHKISSIELCYLDDTEKKEEDKDKNRSREYV